MFKFLTPSLVMDADFSLIWTANFKIGLLSFERPLKRHNKWEIALNSESTGLEHGIMISVPYTISLVCLCVCSYRQPDPWFCHSFLYYSQPVILLATLRNQVNSYLNQLPAAHFLNQIIQNTQMGFSVSQGYRENSPGKLSESCLKKEILSHVQILCHRITLQMF